MTVNPLHYFFQKKMSRREFMLRLAIDSAAELVSSRILPNLNFNIEHKSITSYLEFGYPVLDCMICKIEALSRSQG